MPAFTHLPKPPTILRTYTLATTSITCEIWRTKCLVTDPLPPPFPPTAFVNILVNPTNLSFNGVRNYAYFPKGGPIPPLPPKDAVHSTRWGGMDAGEYMLYPMQSFDGMVQFNCGVDHYANLAVNAKESKGGIGAGISDCVIVEADGKLKDVYSYDYVCHTFPPFHVKKEKNKCELKLGMCYETIFQTCFGGISDDVYLSVPLVGGGCRGFSTDVAVRVATDAVVTCFGATEFKIESSEGSRKVIRFGVVDKGNARLLCEEFDEAVRTVEGVASYGEVI